MEPRSYDVAIIGGGLTGLAIARDAAGRGLSVFLCEQDDLGSGASSQSLKLIHGAIGLIDGMHVAQMREAVMERAIAMNAAPHLMRPLRFVIPYHERLWSETAFRLGLFAFDHAARSDLPRSARVSLEGTAYSALQSHFETGFAYSDCVADDSRLAILNALDARHLGASVHPRLRCVLAEREGGNWRLSLESTLSGEQAVVHAAVVVNAAGAAAVDVHNHVIHSSRPLSGRLRRATAIVVRTTETGQVGYALPDENGRIVFTYPWQRGAMVIGVAERETADAAMPREADPRDIAYLLDVARQYFDPPVWRQDILMTFAAVSPLEEGRGAETVVIDAPPRAPPGITVLGASLTGHRKLAERVVGMLTRRGKVGPPWTARAALPGGGFPARGGGDLVRALRAAYPFVPDLAALRLVRAYGTRASMILTGTRSATDLGRQFGPDLTEAEVRYLMTEEWAVTADDVLWRRSKLGLTLAPREAADLARFMDEQPVFLPAPL